MQFKLTLLLTQIINEWDPVGLRSITPENEYGDEINEIKKFLLENRNVNSIHLGLKIYDVFIHSFSQDIFKCSIDEYKLIALKILDLQK